MEIGVKYRFVQETGSSPQIGIFPMAELATGDSGKGLGNGRTWWRLPVWIQKGWGEWTTYGGAWYVVNRAAGQKNYPFAGWLLQKDIGEKWTLGGEVFAHGRDTVDGQATTLLNAGGVAGLLLFPRPQTAPEHDPMPVTFSRRTGSLWLSLFFALLVGSPLWARLFSGPIVAMVDAFYRAGSLVFGGDMSCCRCCKPRSCRPAGSATKLSSRAMVRPRPSPARCSRSLRFSARP